MKVTIRDVERRDQVLSEFTPIPLIGLLPVGTGITFPTAPYQPKERHARVVDYDAKMIPESSVVREIWMLVSFD
jgi:hypothetical protein